MLRGTDEPLLPEQMQVWQQVVHNLDSKERKPDNSSGCCLMTEENGTCDSSRDIFNSSLLHNGGPVT